MIRAVLAVVLTVALLGVSLPAVDDARHDHADSTIRTELDGFERAATSLLDEDDPTGDERGARRVVTLSIPERSWTTARVESVIIRPLGNASGAQLRWTFRRTGERVRHHPEVPIRTPDGDPVVLESTGDHRLVLTLDGTRERPVVTVRRFTSDDGARGAHARVAIE